MAKKYNKIYGYMVSNKIEDNDIMPFGVHKGTKMANVPAEYLIWLKDQPWLKKEYKDYIDDNMDVLKKELQESKRK